MKKKTVWDVATRQEIKSLIQYGSFNERMRIEKHIHKLMDGATHKQYDILCEVLMLLKQRTKDDNNG